MSTSVQPAARRLHRSPRPGRAFRRAKTLAGALGVTLLGAVLPGTGYLWTRRRLGWLVLLPFLAVVGAAAYYYADVHHAAELAFDPARLRVTAVVLGVAYVVWAFTVVTTYAMARPRGMNRLETSLGVLVVTLLCILLAVPTVKAVRISTTQADFVATVFDDEQTQTIPT